VSSGGLHDRDDHPAVAHDDQARWVEIGLAAVDDFMIRIAAPLARLDHEIARRSEVT
jgi:hypothetical protein